ncbi:CHAT domain-containing protein [Ralstonia pickettii]|uniref:CHAT domain-containing protein n=1 Tax=Cupriavidus sp. DF5525 TaxID=3160989 RepID=UPI0003B07F38|nr:hypothetical protein N234_10155 [Ralstonia pickettii DTP0602]
MKPQDGGTRAVPAQLANSGDTGPKPDGGLTRGATLGQKRAAGAAATSVSALRVDVVNGNLKFFDAPVLVGHYRGSALMGTEAVMDWLIGNAMSTSMRLGRYPQELKTQQVFVNTSADRINPLRDVPRPKGIVVAGLGDEGHLRASGLAETVRLGVIAWAQHLTEAARPPGESVPWPASFSLAATLVGSGGTGMSPGQAARSVAEGVREANRLLASAGWPVVECLSLVELYLDRAAEAWRALQLLVQACPGRFVIKPFIRSSPGALLRPLDSSYRGADFDLITATTQVDVRGASSIIYTLDTRRARTEVRAVAAQGRLLRELVSVASSNTCNDDSVGRTLFKLLVPVEVRPFLAGASEMQIELDPGTAGIPWEMLDSGRDADAGENADYKPWAIRAKLLRKLRTQEFRRQVEDAGRRAPILVIGDPCTDDKRYPLLPGARREARAVSALLSRRLGADRQVKLLAAANDIDRGPDSRQVVATLLDGDWGIVHIAGHGQAASDEAAAADNGAGRAGGVVLSNGTFLGPEELARMQRVPELVFINCCHLAKTDTANLLGTCPTPSFHRPDFAASVAEALIKLGVRCVVAAGWAVDDAAAEIFATAFYRALLDGQRFLDAVAIAREAAYKLPSNTWAAYQCYGDPDWCLPGWMDVGPGGARAASEAPEEEKQRFAAAYAGIASPQGLLLALEMIQMELRVSGANVEQSARRLRYLHDTFGDPERNWARMGAVAEAFATAWREAGLLEEAAAWYQAAFKAADGKATLQSAEQLANVQVRLAWQRLRAVAATAGADVAALQSAVDASRELLLATMGQLAQLLALHRSMERLALCGSASKRLAMVERLAGRRDAEIAAIGETVRWYREAEAAAMAHGARNAYYPAINRCAAELVAHWTAGTEGDYAGDWEGLATASPERNHAEPDFWSRSALSELWVYQCAARRTLSDDLSSILADLGKLHRSLPAINNWRTVRDQADFVLPVYQRHADAAERAAAESLLQCLERWADPAPAGH